MVITAVQALAEDPDNLSESELLNNNCDSSSQIINVKITNEDNKPIYYTYNDRTSILLDKWTWYPKIYIRDPKGPFFPEGLLNYAIQPKCPQDFYNYQVIGSNAPKVWISAISLSDGEKHDYQLEPNQAEKRICGLKPGIYKFIAGTVIQVDRPGEIDTGISVPLSGATPAKLPSPPLTGNDEYGSWECYHLESISEKIVPIERTTTTGESFSLFENHYVYNIYKRYTYNIVRETITCLEPYDKEDNVYILLPTNLENLPMIKPTGASQLISKPIEEDAEASIIGEFGDTAIEHTIAYKFPKLGEKKAGFVSTGFMNIIYIAIDPSYNLDEQLPIKVGGSFAICGITTLMVSTAGVPEVLIGFAVGSVGDFVLTRTLDNIYKETPIKDDTAKALFDDISIEICGKSKNSESANPGTTATTTTTTTTTTESHDIKIINKGSPIYKIRLNTESYELTPPSSAHPKELSFIPQNSMGILEDIPDAFLDDNPQLQCDADIGGLKVQLTWPLLKLVTDRLDTCDETNEPSFDNNCQIVGANILLKSHNYEIDYLPFIGFYAKFNMVLANYGDQDGRVKVTIVDQLESPKYIGEFDVPKNSEVSEHFDFDTELSTMELTPKVQQLCDEQKCKDFSGLVGEPYLKEDQKKYQKYRECSCYNNYCRCCSMEKQI